MNTKPVTDKFLNLLHAANDEDKTGNLYIYLTGLSKKMQVGNLYFLDGKLCGSAFESLAGIEALNTILQLNVVTVMFLDKNKNEIIEQQYMPDVNELILQIKSDPEQAVASSSKLNGNDVQKAVIAILTDIIGPKVSTKIITIAKENPPEENISEFSDECIKFATNYIGNKKALEILSPLFM